METLIELMREIWAVVHGGTWPELGVWSYVLIALLVATEGPVSTLLAAAAAAAGILDIRFVFASALIGNVLGDCLWYWIGYVNNLQSICRRARWFGLRDHHLDRLELEMHTHATKLIALSKLAIGLIVPTLIAAGLAKIPWRRWFPLVLVIEIVWTFLMTNLGYHATGLIAQVERSLQIFGLIALIILFSAIVWYAKRMYRQSEEAFAAEQQLAQPPLFPLAPPSQPFPTLVTRQAVFHPPLSAANPKETPKPRNRKLNRRANRKLNHKVNFVFEDA